METKYGSLTRGMLAARGKMRAQAKTSSKTPNGGAAIFTGLRGGMGMLVDAIAERLDAGSVRLATAVSGIEKTARGWKVRAGGVSEDFDALIVAVPAWIAGELLTPVDAALGSELGGIPYSSSITVNLIYDEGKIGPLPEGFGFLVPAVEGRAMLACTFAHRKFLGRTPPGKAVFRAFLGGMKRVDLLAESDEALVEIVRREMREILGAKTFGAEVEPEFAQVTRWRRAMAQYAVGHKARMQRVSARVMALPGLRLVGNAYDGIGVPDCIRLGRKAARELAGVPEPAVAARR
jgi:oxygen-dependent protoporphyrinogen oxidase